MATDFLIFCVSKAVMTTKSRTTITDITKSTVLLLKIKMFTKETNIIPNNPIRQILPAFDKSIFVTSPKIAIMKKIPAATRKVEKIDVIVYMVKYKEKIIPIPYE